MPDDIQDTVKPRLTGLFSFGSKDEEGIFMT